MAFTTDMILGEFAEAAVRVPEGDTTRPAARAAAFWAAFYGGLRDSRRRWVAGHREVGRRPAPRARRR